MVIALAAGIPLAASAQALGEISDADFAGFVLKNTNQLRYEIAVGHGYRLESLIFALEREWSDQTINCLREISSQSLSSYELFQALNQFRMPNTEYDSCPQ